MGYIYRCFILTIGEMNDLPPTAQHPPPATMGLWLGYGALCVGMFMAILDIQVVVTSLHVIEEALGIGADRMSWVQTTYLIAEVISIPLTGLLIRIFTMRWLFAGAILMFTLASIGCAMSVDFYSLIIFRVLQGAAGGVLIPLVFSAIFLLFGKGFKQTVATTVGGLLAVLAPTFGPLTGGWITENYSWHWLFLINVVPGAVCLAVGILTLPKGATRLSLFRTLDWVSLLLIIAGLSALLIGLKKAPSDGWISPPVAGCFAIVLACAALTLRRPDPVISFSLLRDRNLAFGCLLSFILGLGLFGSVYMMPLFLAFVHGMTPLSIGTVILVTGIAQLAASPITVQVDRFVDARLLSAIGFFAFSIGLFMSGFQTVHTGYDEMFWPQVVRGTFVALCILPPIRFALGFMPREHIADASGLFNLSRNLGGAIGIALIDTIVFSRGPDHADMLMDLLKTDPAKAAGLMGLATADLPDPGDPSGLMGIMDVIQQASLTLAINEAWLLLGGITLLAVLLLAFMGPIRLPSTAAKDGRT
jgi:MFS transporter, DHA2 family, multidrug resistance protein